MTPTDKERSVLLGEYMVKNKATVRACAKQFGISKSTVHKDVSQRLEKTDPKLYKKVRKLLSENKAQRHIRGGLATREKYQKQKDENK
ncbi:MAG: sporulation transcriptional regulator SpoIIID [Oscillospiraceae bacterium]|nr:sporulation transcriptional regulator SpoIIID [Oscillospiraceae bacterium]